MQGMIRKNAMDKARRQSATEKLKKTGARVYVFRHAIESDQYYTQGEYYILEVGREKSFNLGGKDNVFRYLNGKRV